MYSTAPMRWMRDDSGTSSALSISPALFLYIEHLLSTLVGIIGTPSALFAEKATRERGEIALRVLAYGGILATNHC